MAVMGLWVVSFSNLLHNGVETWFVISSVRNDSSCSISFFNCVFSLHGITITNFPLALVITSMRIFYSIFKFVFWVCIIILMVFGTMMFIASMFFDVVWNNRYAIMMVVLLMVNRVMAMLHFNFVSWWRNYWSCCDSNNYCEDNLKWLKFNYVDKCGRFCNFYQLTANDFIICFVNCTWILPQDDWYLKFPVLVVLYQRWTSPRYLEIRSFMKTIKTFCANITSSIER